MPKENFVVCGYVRVSTDTQLDNYSIDEQSDRIRAYCAAKGWVLLNIYTDGGFSGGNTNRPALRQMLQDVRTNEIDAVVVYKLDRLSRSQKDTLTLIEDELLAHKTDFISINENFDTSTPFGRAMIGMLSVFAQLEKDQITERFMMGRIGRSKAGSFHGGGNAPTGYDYIDGNLIVNEYEALQVREVFQQFLNGRSINAIHRDLESRYTTKWTATKVRNVLKNSLYIGKVKFYGQEYQGVHMPLIDEGTYREANRLLTSSAREASKSPAQKNPFRASYLLSGLVCCGLCGAKYSANHGYYKCYSRAKSSPKFVKDPNCKNENWKIEALDELVIQQVEALLSNPENVKKVLATAKQKTRVKIDKEKLRRRCEEIDVQIKKLIELYQVSTIPISVVTDQVSKLSAEKETLEKQMEAPEEIPSVELFLQALEDYRDSFSTGDTDKKRMLLSALIRQITIVHQSVEVHWRF